MTKDTESAKPKLIRFESFELDLGTSQLRCGGVLSKLQPQPARVLGLLASNPGVLVTRQQLRQHIWGDETFVDFEQALNFCIRQIREALDDDAKSPRFIETLPRRGYRFLVVPESVKEREAPAAPALRIGVMPFAHPGTEEGQDYFSEGLTGEMMSMLSRLARGRLRVIARETMQRARSEGMNLSRLRDELGLDYLLEGTVRRLPDRIRIAVELTDVKDQTLVWAEAYERRPTDLFSIQSEVARRVARSLALELLPGSVRQLAKSSTESPGYELYLKGRHFFQKLTADNVLASIRYFEQAIAADPNYALAYAGLADCYSQMGSIRIALLTPTEALLKAKPMAVRALELDDALPEAHNALALVKCWYEMDWSGADAEFRQALALNPDNVTHAPWYSVYLTAVDECERALAEIYRAREIDPLSPIINAYVGIIHLFSGQPEPAVQRLEEAIPLDPSYYRPYMFLGQTLLALRRYAEALDALRKAQTRAPRNLEVIGLMGAVQAQMGDIAEARTTLGRLIEAAGEKFDPSLFAAAIYAPLGEIDKALESIECAIERRFNPIYLVRLIGFDALYTYPRYLACLRRIGLPPPRRSTPSVIEEECSD
jgi:TolB-like protein/Tfp pilus assembly protein PilF